MGTAITQVQSDIIEQVIIKGDLSQLSPAERVNYYRAVCESVGLNPLTKPFDYISLKGKLTLYAKKDATDQLRRINGVSITRLERDRIDGIYVVTAYATTGERQDSSTGAVNVDGLRGDELANAFMKAETKAKRRVTLSLCGLGWLDETEVETIPDAKRFSVSENGDLGPQWTEYPTDHTDTAKTMTDRPPEPEIVEQKWTVETAGAVTTLKGTRLAECTLDQLVLLTEKANGEIKKAAKFLVDNIRFNASFQDDAA